LDAQSLDGKLYSLSDNDKQVNRAFVFLSTSCPISNSYISELNRLTQALPPGVELFGVFSEPTTSRQNASKHFAEYKAEFPILFDGSQLLLDVLKPTHVPEAFFINAVGEVVYRGAIDNAYEAVGRRRVNVENHYLEDAIKAVAANKKPVVNQTKPVGCVLPPDGVNAIGTKVTFARDIAPILQQRCETCHRPGQVAPFSLTDYEEAKSHAEMLVEVTRQRIMPPWIPGPETAHRFIGQRWLSDLHRTQSTAASADRYTDVELQLARRILLRKTDPLESWDQAVRRSRLRQLGCESIESILTAQASHLG
jgi:hypothetical protein